MKTKWKEQELTMSYHQFTLFQKGQPKPHHDWSDEDIQKGYVADDKAISFEAVSNTKAIIEVWVNETPGASRAEKTTRLPFHVESDGIEIKSVLSETLSYDIPKGYYYVTCLTIPLQEKTNSGLYLVKYLLHFESQ
ncbi:competence protein ComJ [Priestia megaterium]